jgi:penicillin amidase
MKLASIAVLLPLSLSCGDNLEPDDGDGDGDGIAIPELTAPVDAYLDDAGVLHMSCATDADCFAAQGYFHARHRFFQMDLRRRFARGTISEVAGNLALDIDAQQRLLHSTPDGQPLENVLLDNADAATREAISAYTRGVNAFIADLRAGDNGAKTADERGVDQLDSSVLTDWDDLDTAASVLLLTDILTNTATDEIELGDAFARLGPVAANDLFTRRPPSPSIIAPPSGAAPAAAPRAASLSAAHLAMLERYRPLFERVRERWGPAGVYSDRGSNNWVVGPSLAGGKALLANDPHLGLSNPSVWYLNHLDAKTEGSGTIHAAGVSFAGAPGVLIGFNENVAWGMTNTAADFVDVYMETLTSDDTAVVLNGAPVDIVEVDHPFAVAGEDEPVVQTLRYVPHHGPIVDFDPPNDAALSLRWTVNDADTDLNFIRGLMTATSIDEARAALEQVTTAGQNVVIIDDQGSIGWFPYSRYPERPWAATTPPYLPLPGDGTAEWGDPIPYADIPQAQDPAQGYIATANNDWTGALADGDPTNDSPGGIFQWFVDLGYRHERIAELIEDSSSHDMASMSAIQHDTRSNFGAAVVPGILAVANGLAGVSANGQELIAALAGWDFECPTGLVDSDPDGDAVTDGDTLASSAGCAAFHALWPRLEDGIFSDELADAGVQRRPYRNATALLFIEADPFSGRDYFDDVSTGGAPEEVDDVVAAAIESAATFLVNNFSADRATWLWGRLHTSRLRADLFGQFGVNTFDTDPFSTSGGFNTVDVANPFSAHTGDFSHRSGASMRLVCSAGGGDPMTCTIELPGGNSHHRDEAFYLNLLPAWLSDSPTPFRFSIAEAEAAAVETFRMVSEE